MEKEKKYKGKKIVQLKESIEQPTQYVATIVPQSASVWRILENSTPLPRQWQYVATIVPQSASVWRILENSTPLPRQWNVKQVAQILAPKSNYRLFG
jgi:hypothetical protein